MALTLAAPLWLLLMAGILLVMHVKIGKSVTLPVVLVAIGAIMLFVRVAR